MGSLKLKSKHRVLCGDSTKVDDVERLMDEEVADATVTDLPYGIKYQSGNQRGEEGHALANDDHISDGWTAPAIGVEPWRAWVKDSAVVVLTSSKEELVEFTGLNGEIESGRWRKVSPYQNDMRELIFVIGELDACCDVEYPYWHDSVKPTGAVAYVVRRVSVRGSTVCDPFLGSGTTLIAAEQLGRKCYGLEISPAYCDVIVNRWEKLTGEKAVNAKTGEPFSPC